MNLFALLFGRKKHKSTKSFLMDLWSKAVISKNWEHISVTPGEEGVQKHTGSVIFPIAVGEGMSKFVETAMTKDKMEESQVGETGVG